MPRKSQSKKNLSDMSMSELVAHAEQRIEEISQQRIAEVRALFDEVLSRTQLSIREVYGQVKRQASEAASKVAAEFESNTGTRGGKRKASKKAAGKRKASTAGKTGYKPPVKFRHPNDANLTWTGRGSQPRWLREALEAGGNIETFRVGPAPAKAARASKAAKKTRRTRKVKAKA